MSECNYELADIQKEEKPEKLVCICRIEVTMFVEVNFDDDFFVEVNFDR